MWTSYRRLHSPVNILFASQHYSFISTANQPIDKLQPLDFCHSQSWHSDHCWWTHFRYFSASNASPTTTGFFPFPIMALWPLLVDSFQVCQRIQCFPHYHCNLLVIHWSSRSPLQDTATLGAANEQHQTEPTLLLIMQRLLCLASLCFSKSLVVHRQHYFLGLCTFCLWTK